MIPRTQMTRTLNQEIKKKPQATLNRACLIFSAIGRSRRHKGLNHMV